MGERSLSPHSLRRLDVFIFGICRPRSNLDCHPSVVLRQRLARTWDLPIR